MIIVFMKNWADLRLYKKMFLRSLYYAMNFLIRIKKKFFVKM